MPSRYGRRGLVTDFDELENTNSSFSELNYSELYSFAETIDDEVFSPVEGDNPCNEAFVQHESLIDEILNSSGGFVNIEPPLIASTPMHLVNFENDFEIVQPNYEIEPKDANIYLESVELFAGSDLTYECFHANFDAIARKHKFLEAAKKKF